MMSSVGETGAGGRNSKLINTNYSPYFIGSISSLVLDAKQILLVFKTNEPRGAEQNANRTSTSLFEKDSKLL